MNIVDTTNFHNRQWKTCNPSKGASVMSSEEKPDRDKYQKPEGIDVFHWPEFKALAKRLMINLEEPITCISIILPCDAIAKVIVEKQGLDETQKLE